MRSKVETSDIGYILILKIRQYNSSDQAIL